MEFRPNTVDLPTKNSAEQSQKNSIVDDWIRQVVMTPAQQLAHAESEMNANRRQLLPKPLADASTADWMASYLAAVVEQTQALLSDAGTSSNVSPPLSSIGGDSCCAGDDDISDEEDRFIGTHRTEQKPDDDDTAATKAIDWRWSGHTAATTTTSSGDRQSYSSSCRHLPTDNDANDDDDLSQSLNKINLFRPPSLESLFAGLSQISSDDDIGNTDFTGRSSDAFNTRLATPSPSPSLPAQLHQSSPIAIEPPPSWAPSRLRPKTHADLARAVDAAFPFAATDEVQPYKSDGRSLMPARANVVSTVIRRNGANYVEDVSRQLTRLSNSSDGISAVSTPLHMVTLNYGTRNRMSPGELLQLNADDCRTDAGYVEPLGDVRHGDEIVTPQPNAPIPPLGFRTQSVPSSLPTPPSMATNNATGGCTGTEFIEQLAEKLWQQAMKEQQAQQHGMCTVSPTMSSSADSGCGGDRSPIPPTQRQWPQQRQQWQQHQPLPLGAQNTPMSTKRSIVGRSRQQQQQQQLGDITNSWFGGGRTAVGWNGSSASGNDTRSSSHGYYGSSVMGSSFSGPLANNNNNYGNQRHGSGSNNMNSMTRNICATGNNSSHNKENHYNDLLMRPVFCEFCRNTGEPV